jgi:nitrous oxide reductase accessory protein NosL
MIHHGLSDGLRAIAGGTAMMLFAVALQACGRKEEAPAPTPAPASPTSFTDVQGAAVVTAPGFGYRVTNSKKDLDGSEID